MSVELVSYPDPETLAGAAASQWLNAVATFTGARYCVALSGGRIARLFFTTVAADPRARAGVLGQVHFFWSDERCLPPGDPESNFGLARDCLLEPLGIPEANVHRIRGEDSPPLAAAEAEAELRRIALPSGVRPSPGAASPEQESALAKSGGLGTAAVAAPGDGPTPVLDLVFLGMGEDGHVASLFPGETEEMMAWQAVFRPVIAPKPPPQRVTMGYGVIAAAKAVWVLASGRGKAGALRNSLSAGGRTPLGRVLELRQHTRVLTDIAV